MKKNVYILTDTEYRMNHAYAVCAIETVAARLERIHGRPSAELFRRRTRRLLRRNYMRELGESWKNVFDGILPLCAEAVSEIFSEKTASRGIRCLSRFPVLAAAVLR